MHLTHQDQRDVAYGVRQPGRQDVLGALKEIAEQQPRRQSGDQPEGGAEGLGDCSLALRASASVVAKNAPRNDRFGIAALALELLIQQVSRYKLEIKPEMDVDTERGLTTRARPSVSVAAQARGF